MTGHQLDFRPLGDDDVDAALDLLGLVFAEDFGEEDRARETSVQDFSRSLGAFEGGRLVGCLGDYPFQMSIPGGEVPAAGTTWVGVSPTHRRRGIMRGLMTRHLQAAVDRGEPMAALWASQAGIYGRFGYGAAINMHNQTLIVDEGLTWQDTAPGVDASIRFVPLDEAADVLDPIYQSCRIRRAGMHIRDEMWWKFQVLSTRKSCMAGAENKYVAVAAIDGRDAAYAVYGLTYGKAEPGRNSGVVKVTELAGVDAHAEGAMWRFLASHDLMAKVEAPRRPVDDPLALMLADSRRVQRRLSDALYVRILDLPAMLRARSYRASVGFTVEVTDAILDANDGTWRIEVAPEGAAIEAADSDDAPDLRMDVRAMAVLFMGDVSLTHLAAAGMIEVRDPGVVADVESAFAVAEAGWAPEVW